MEGFRKSQRLLKPAHFEKILRKPAMRKSRGQLQLLASRNNIARARLGLIVPKRVLAKAHDRNRVKRLIREAFRRRAAALPAVDMVIRLRGPADSALQENLEWLLAWLEQ